MSASTTRIVGVSVVWIAVYAALLGAVSIVPLFPYPGGGGYLPLSVPLEAIAPLILGPYAGIIAAFIGGVLGMLISPGAFPLGLLDVTLTGTLPAVFAAFTINGNKFWKAWTPILLLNGLAYYAFPFNFPGTAGGFNPPDFTFYVVHAWFWVPWLILYVSPVGTKWIPTWARGTDRKKKFAGIYLGLLIGIMGWYLIWSWPYWYILQLQYDFATTASLVGWSWALPAFTGITTVICIPIVEALRVSGFPKIPLSIW